jgi:hypothetical protein
VFARSGAVLDSTGRIGRDGVAGEIPNGPKLLVLNSNLLRRSRIPSRTGYFTYPPLWTGVSTLPTPTRFAGRRPREEGHSCPSATQAHNPSLPFAHFVFFRGQKLNEQPTPFIISRLAVLAARLEATATRTATRAGVGRLFGVGCGGFCRGWLARWCWRRWRGRRRCRRFGRGP